MGGRLDSIWTIDILRPEMTGDIALWEQYRRCV